MRLPSLPINPRVQYSPSTLCVDADTPSTIGWRSNSSFTCSTVSPDIQVSASTSPGILIPISPFIR